MDTNYIATINESFVNLNNIKKDNNLLRIGELVEKDRSRDAIKIFENIEKKYREITIVKNTSSVEFNLAIKNLRAVFDKIIGHPQLGTVLAVLGQKLDQYNDFVSQNNWKTLTRIGTKLKSLVYLNKDQNINKLIAVIDSLKKNNAIMISIVDSSILEPGQRAIIKDRLDSINFEVEILSAYIIDTNKFLLEFNNFKNAYSKWVDDSQKTLLFEKGILHEKSKKLFFYFMVLLSSSFMLMIGGIILYRKTSKMLTSNAERYFLSLLQNSILSSKAANLHAANASGKALSHLSREQEGSPFWHEIRKMHTYVQKRMSFSSIFQEALPFPATLLDSNLKIVWVNPLFCECFKMGPTEFENDSLSWDYLIKFTNISENNPVLDALNNNISGIYQIKIRPDQKSDLVSYEMYVNPISSGSIKAVMLFFYPLSSIEETINSQALSLVEPINKMLDAIVQNSFTDDFRKNIESDFHLINIPDVYNRLISMYEFYTVQRQGLLGEIDRLENEIRDHYKLLADIDIKNREYKKIQVDLLDSLNSMKRNIISYIDSANGHVDQSDNVMNLFKNIMDTQANSEKITDNMVVCINETKKVMDSVFGARNDLKGIKENLNIINAKMIQFLDKALIYEYTENNEVRKLCVFLSKIKNEVLSADKELEAFFSVFKNLDLKLSKLSMFVIDYEKGLNDIKNIEDSKDSLLVKLEDSSYDKNNILQKHQMYEDKIVKNLETFFGSYRRNLGYFKDLTDLVGGFLGKEKIEVMPTLIDDNKSDYTNKTTDYISPIIPTTSSSTDSRIYL